MSNIHFIVSSFYYIMKVKCDVLVDYFITGRHITSKPLRPSYIIRTIASLEFDSKYFMYIIIYYLLCVMYYLFINFIY